MRQNVAIRSRRAGSQARHSTAVNFMVAAGFAAGALAAWHPPAHAQTFNEANSTAVTNACNPANAAGRGSNLNRLCGRLVIPETAVVSGGGAFSPVQSSERAVEERLIASEAESGRGGSSDALEVGFGRVYGAFLSAGAFSLTHLSNEAEQGYRGTVPTVTAGLEVRPSDRFVAGVAFNYTHTSADYSGGGDFAVDSFSPIIYTGFRPIDRGFVDVVFAYTRHNNANNRQALAVSSGGTFLSGGASPADVGSNQYAARIHTGYDYDIGNFTVGPRLGLNISGRSVDDYRDTGSTGLELAYQGYGQTSVQSALGAAARYTYPTSFGAIVSRLRLAWLHEFANDPVTISARLIEAPAGVDQVRFRTESTARNWLEVGFGLSLDTGSQVKPFINVAAIAGNSNFESVGGTAGVYVTW